VVDLRQQRDAPALEPVDHVELPQRAAAVERAPEHTLHRLGQLPVVARRGQRGLTDMEVQVEVRVVDPVGEVEPERDLGQPPAQRRQQVQPLLEQLLHLRRTQLAVRRRRGVVDPQERHVSVDPGRFDVEELGVEAGQLAHRMIRTGVVARRRKR
jgi:hypothetical protein